MHVSGKPYFDHDPEFIDEALRVGASLNSDKEIYQYTKQKYGISYRDILKLRKKGISTKPFDRNIIQQEQLSMFD